MEDSSVLKRRKLDAHGTYVRRSCSLELDRPHKKQYQTQAEKVWVSTFPSSTSTQQQAMHVQTCSDDEESAQQHPVMMHMCTFSTSSEDGSDDDMECIPIERVAHYSGSSHMISAHSAGHGQVQTHHTTQFSSNIGANEAISSLIGHAIPCQGMPAQQHVQPSHPNLASHLLIGGSLSQTTGQLVAWDQRYEQCKPNNGLKAAFDAMLCGFQSQISGRSFVHKP